MLLLCASVLFIIIWTDRPACWSHFFYFLSERDYVMFGSLLSQICLSSITFVRATQPVEIFGNISPPFCTLAIPGQRSSQGNPSVGGVKHKRGGKIERWWTYQSLYFIAMSRSGISSPGEFLVISAMLLRLCC